MRIFLIGFMACGKTYLGRIIAEKLNYTFVDLDIWIEKEMKLSINEIFKTKGELFFRKLEKKYLSEITQKFKKIVVATGGGTPCFFDNLEFINKNGISIYLKTKEQILFNRLILEKYKRPLVKNKTKQELMDFIKKTLKKRKKYYLKADFTVSVSS